MHQSSKPIQRSDVWQLSSRSFERWNACQHQSATSNGDARLVSGRYITHLISITRQVWASGLFSQRAKDSDNPEVPPNDSLSLDLSLCEHACVCVSVCSSQLWYTAARHRWEGTKNKYFVTALKQSFQKSALCFSISLSDHFLLLLPTFVLKYLYFLLLSLEKPIVTFVFKSV